MSKDIDSLVITEGQKNDVRLVYYRRSSKFKMSDESTQPNEPTESFQPKESSPSVESGQPVEQVQNTPSTQPTQPTQPAQPAQSSQSPELIQQSKQIEVPPPIDTEPEKPSCRHEYITIYQRKLKGLDRRLVGTRAFLPVGFKMTDFKHLSLGSFVFCSKCRKRLYPKRTQAEKLAAKLERKRLKELEIAKLKEEAGELGASVPANIDDDSESDALDGIKNSTSGMPFGLSKRPIVQDVDEDEDDEDEEDDGVIEDTDLDDTDVESGVDIHVEELEVESVDVLDIKAEGVKISSDDEIDGSCEDGDDDS